ncbi:hypothetical protein H1R20_g15145, partial [Candolleomyces eurysporus]
MVVPIVSGLDKTTVSVATGHQEYHPFYFSAGNLTNLARRSHGNGVVPIAFLPIPKVSNRQKKRKEFKTFARQLYHTCIRLIFEPLRSGMTNPEVMRCPDGHFRRAVFSIGPVIADYPEQVWLAGVVQNWCPKDFAPPENLDDPTATRRTHEKTDFLVNHYDRAMIWDSFGVRDDVVPFTHSFPRADIHELLSPDLLHQVIKGTFKDHLVSWINNYIHSSHPTNKALEIIQDIDRRISAVPSHPGLRRFPDGRNFTQWTGDDSKALMKVYLAAVVDYIPEDMTKCLASFLELCYIFRRNAITASALNEAEQHLKDFHRLRDVFVETGVRAHCSLPRQHALKHFPPGISDFGASNGLCSSITKSKHITAVKKPWRRSSRFNALSQMLQIIVRLDKLATLQRLFWNNGMLQGSTSAYMALTAANNWQPLEQDSDDTENGEEWEQELVDDERLADVAPIQGPRFASSVLLASTRQPNYPQAIEVLAQAISMPQFANAFLDYLFRARFPTQQPPVDIARAIFFTGRIYVHHSAVCRFFAPSDACGAGGMQHQIIRCNPTWRQKGRYDTVFVSESDEPGMAGMMIAQLRLLFSFNDPVTGLDHECALVNWFPLIADEPDQTTGMWIVEREEEEGEAGGFYQPLQVISLATIVRGAHLLPVYGKGYLPENFDFADSLEAFQSVEEQLKAMKVSIPSPAQPKAGGSVLDAPSEPSPQKTIVASLSRRARAKPAGMAGKRCEQTPEQSEGSDDANFKATLGNLLKTPNKQVMEESLDSDIGKPIDKGKACVIEAGDNAMEESHDSDTGKPMDKEKACAIEAGDNAMEEISFLSILVCP